MRHRSWFLVVGLILAAGLGVAIVTTRPPDQAGPEPAGSDELLGPGLDLVMEDITHEAVRNGRLQWRLFADEALFSKSGQTITVEGVRMTLFDASGQPMEITADTGTVHTATDDLALSGQVVVSSQGLTLEADRLDYDNENQRLVSDEPVTIVGHSLRVKANSFSHDVNDQVTRLTGQVKTVFEPAEETVFETVD